MSAAARAELEAIGLMPPSFQQREGAQWPRSQFR